MRSTLVLASLAIAGALSSSPAAATGMTCTPAAGHMASGVCPSVRSRDKPAVVAQKPGGTGQPEGTAGGEGQKVCVHSIIGLSLEVSEAVKRELAVALQKLGLPVAPCASPWRGAALMGYLAVTKEGEVAKLAHIFDLVDPAGKRVHRIFGQEALPVAAGSAENVSLETIRRLAEDVATKLAKHLQP